MNGAPEWKEPVGRLEENIDGLKDDIRNLNDDIKALNLRLWGALIGVVLLLGERVLNQIEMGTPDATASIITIILSVF